ncbi:uncharacterized protein VICG_02052 [Vittaforma corneae ATCC 50505]|uniref:Nucleoporin NSP1-like C-terminal domain-containing protein n=1 Tax=Vittaforma corneae (strain ATCC 50505) TaxID=993615 RepID=L2GKT6_VITCO|nr:uncharacterized protein VICG_02052 [Vittaforma corneae ATCC 50505]ELA40912.1 hypothetical protein VICG_02052 [Vittaforma corneae ATCC 50505]
MNNPFSPSGDNQSKQGNANNTTNIFEQNASKQSGTNVFSNTQPSTNIFGSNFSNPFGSAQMPPNQISSSAPPQNSPLSSGAPPGLQFSSGNNPFTTPAIPSSNLPFNTAQQSTMPPGSSVFDNTQQNISPTSGINQFSSSANNPVGAEPSSTAQTSLFSSNATPFGSNQQARNSTAPSVNPFGTLQQSFDTQTPSTTLSNIETPSARDTTFGQSRKPADQSSLMSSVKDNSINLYNLTLQEAIDRHSSILETNIKDFERDAQSIFERDLQLIKNKNNYISIRNKIDEENVRLDELSQVLDYFEERLSSIEDEHRGASVSDSAKVIEDFETICDKFYKKIESFKDEQGEVLDLVNENYQIIETIDRKLDILSQIKNIK